MCIIIHWGFTGGERGGQYMVRRHPAWMSHQVAVERELMVKDLVGLDLNICRLALSTTQGLMDHDAAVGKAVALALGWGGHSAAARRHREA